MTQQLTTIETEQTKHIETNEFKMEIFKSKTVRKQTGCGSIYVTICYKQDDETKIDRIRILGDGKNECGNSYNESLGDLCSFAIRRIRNQYEAQAIIKALKYHRCNRVLPNKEHICSCGDAISRILEQELIKEEEKTT